MKLTSEEINAIFRGEELPNHASDAMNYMWESLRNIRDPYAESGTVIDVEVSSNLPAIRHNFAVTSPWPPTGPVYDRWTSQ